MNERINNEEIVEPDLPICDSHHHLWRRPEYDYLLDDFLGDTCSGHRILSSVFVECGTNYTPQVSPALAPVGETLFADAAAAATTGKVGLPEICAAIVGFADLSTGAAVSETLDAHIAASSRFRGIRHCAAYDPDRAIVSAAHSPVFAEMIGSARFRAGFAQLEPRGLTFDMWVYHRQIPEVVALAHAFPGIQIILDHLGGPLGIGPYRDRRSEVMAEWKESIRLLAQCANVSIKLGGICMPLNGWKLHKREVSIGSIELAEMLRDHVLFAIDQFGVGRCLFESNYPADRSSVRYAVLWNTFKRIVADFSACEKAQLFYDNATRFYRIGDVPNI